MTRDIIVYNPDENMLVNLSTDSRIYIYQPQGGIEFRLYHKSGHSRDSSQVIARGKKAQMQDKLNKIVDSMRLTCNIVDIGYHATTGKEGEPNE